MNGATRGGARRGRRAGAVDDATAPGPGVDRDLPLDAHLHTDLSPDSDVPIDVYCAAGGRARDPGDRDHRPRGLRPARARPCVRRVRDARARGARSGGALGRPRARRPLRHRGHLRIALRGGDPRAPGRAIRTTSRSARSTSCAYSPYIDDRVAGWVAGRSFDEIVAPYFAEVDGRDPERALRHASATWTT